MKLSTFSAVLLPALVLASEDAQATPSEPQPAILSAAATQPFVPAQSTAAPSSFETRIQSARETAPEQVLELRQAAAAVTVGATQAATQVSPITNEWLPTVLPDGQTTYVDVFYTQTFASVPEQYSAAKSGSIGMGTLTGSVGVVKTSEAEKSNAASRATGVVGGSYGVAAVAVLGALVGAAIL